ncbi:helical backbone metal receptor [Nibrella saemangeumensis]|uniref:Helical backbone metal receptor n=1 Tax=Nibrella saemangeumensis TaxID=1084526 RepID=A0ABP8MQD7_9BACT
MPPQRIVSLVPSQTELLFDLGLDEEIVGLTKFCIHPKAKVSLKTIVGGTKTLHLDRIHALQPDLIIANREENTRDQIEELQRHYPVHITDVVTLTDALIMIRTVGELVAKEQEAQTIADEIEHRFTGILPLAPRLRTAYFIWRNPWMGAAADTFIHSMLLAAGFQNVFAHRSRYPEITEQDLQASQPELILLSSEPYPFRKKHIAELQQWCPSARVMLVDGELFSWYGSRLLRSAAYFRELH